MSEIYNKTKTGNYNVAQLQTEINQSPLVVPSCLGITAKGEDLKIEFASALSTGSPSEETYLDDIIASHAPTPTFFETIQLPFSRHLENKLAVHSSPKPEPEGVTTYAMWAGCGDDLTVDPDQSLGAGEILSFDVTMSDATIVKDVKFDPAHGRVWVHQAHIQFENAGNGDNICAHIVAPATPLLTGSPLQGSPQIASPDYIVEDDWVKYAGPGAGTHALAGTPSLVLRSFSKDGDWDYDGVNLTPNFGGTGKYKITATERVVHKYVHNLPVYGTCPTYFSISSDETAELPVNMGYFVRIVAKNASSSDWHMSIIMEIYRERTSIP